MKTTNTVYYIIFSNIIIIIENTIITKRNLQPTGMLQMIEIQTKRVELLFLTRVILSQFVLA